MHDAKLTQPAFRLVIARNHKSDNSDASGIEPGQRVTIESA